MGGVATAKQRILIGVLLLRTSAVLSVNFGLRLLHGEHVAGAVFALLWSRGCRQCLKLCLTVNLRLVFKGLFVVFTVLLCQYFGAQEECQFCDINHNWRQHKKEGRPYTGVKPVEDVLEALAIDQVGEFVELASVLLEIKARALVPRPEEIEEPVEMNREDLVQRLLEYKQYRDAAVLLDVDTPEALAALKDGAP